MANVCEYEIHVKGTKKAAYVLYESTICYNDDKSILFESGSEDKYEMHFTGDCKWSVNYGVNDSWNGAPVDLGKVDDDDVTDIAMKLVNYSLRAKSEALNCEIQVRYWSGESDFDQFDRYINGRIERSRSIPYNYEYHKELESRRRAEAHKKWEMSIEDNLEPVGKMQEKNRIQNIESVRKGDVLKLNNVTKLNEITNTYRGEVFSKNNLSLGEIIIIDSKNEFDPENIIITAVNVEPLSVRKKQNSRARVPKLEVRISITNKKNMPQKEENILNKMLKNTEGYFDWDKLEYYGHEGSTENYGEAEASDNDFMSKLRGLSK
ncbi:MAG: hypothetical protein IKD89_02110 [Clostridia bacterium]|nr:hypothetical protein [Clostridia bacterium]